MNVIKQQLENSEQACARLSVSAQTLYAYVSRGLLRTTQHPDDSRKRLYLSNDVDQLVARQARGRSRQEIAKSTVDFGEPVFRSQVSSIKDGQFFYRGINAIHFSRTASLEDAFELLCDASISAVRKTDRVEAVSPHNAPIARFVDALAKRVSCDNSYGNRRTALNLLRLIATNAAKQERKSDNELIHQQLANSWSSDPRAADSIRRALVLSADHELNASTYATRVAASAGASLPACLLAGVSTLSGKYHGGLTDLCGKWMIETSKQSLSKFAPLKGQLPPGFGHRLYPNGDPRAVEILRCCEAPRPWRSIARKVTKENSAGHPTLDYGLAVLEHQLKLPRGSGFSIFAVGRTVGWLAHCFEQRKTGSLIRPRASNEQ